MAFPWEPSRSASQHVKTLNAQSRRDSVVRLPRIKMSPLRLSKLLCVPGVVCPFFGFVFLLFFRGIVARLGVAWFWHYIYIYFFFFVGGPSAFCFVLLNARRVWIFNKTWQQAPEAKAQNKVKAWPKGPMGSLARRFTYNNHKKKLPASVANFAAAVVYAS